MINHSETYYCIFRLTNHSLVSNKSDLTYALSCITGREIVSEIVLDDCSIHGLVSPLHWARHHFNRPGNRGLHFSQILSDSTTFAWYLILSVHIQMTLS